MHVANSEISNYFSSLCMTDSIEYYVTGEERKEWNMFVRSDVFMIVHVLMLVFWAVMLIIRAAPLWTCQINSSFRMFMSWDESILQATRDWCFSLCRVTQRLLLHHIISLFVVKVKMLSGQIPSNFANFCNVVLASPKKKKKKNLFFMRVLNPYEIISTELIFLQRILTKLSHCKL
jgi:hypothetical protein